MLESDCWEWGCETLPSFPPPFMCVLRSSVELQSSKLDWKLARHLLFNFVRIGMCLSGLYKLLFVFLLFLAMVR